MPLLRKKPFVPVAVPADIQPDDLVFYCKVTGEMFTDYEKFFERVILCNSLVWTCSITSRTGLTFQEALDSERRAKNRRVEFNIALVRALLTIAAMTRRRKLADVCSDVFDFASERYFKFEFVNVLIDGTTKQCLVEHVLPPDKVTSTNGRSAAATGSDADSDVICLDDDSNGLPPAPPPSVDPVASSSSAGGTNFLSLYGSNPRTYRYIASIRHGTDLHIVPWSSVSRLNPNDFSRDRCLTFLRQNCWFDESDGFWQVKPDLMAKHRLLPLNFEYFFAGPPPNFEFSPPLTSPLSTPATPESSVKKAPASKSKHASRKSSAPKKARMQNGDFPQCDPPSDLSSVIDLTEDDDGSEPTTPAAKPAARGNFWTPSNSETTNDLRRFSDSYAKKRPRKDGDQAEHSARRRKSDLHPRQMSAEVSENIPQAKKSTKTDRGKGKSTNSVVVRESAAARETAILSTIAAREAAAREANAALKEAAEKEHQAKMAAARAEAAAREEEAVRRYREYLAQKELIRKQAEEDRERRKVQVAEDKARKRQEKYDLEERMRQWSRPREDMECDDLKDLPIPTPVECMQSSDAFGDVVFVMEFLLCFKPVLNLDLPKNLSLESLGQSLVKPEVDGIFSDVVCQLLASVLRLRDEEEPHEVTLQDILELVDACDDEDEAVKSATLAARLPFLDYGTQLNDIQLDGTTVSEILRLHLLSSGAKRLPSVVKSDLQQRGAYTARDDPGLDFCRQEKRVMEALRSQSVFSLEPNDRIKILLVLVHQLLTFPACRNYVDDSYVKLRAAQQQLRSFQFAEQRRARDETQFWHRKKLEERLKLMGVTLEHPENGSANGETAKQPTLSDSTTPINSRATRSKKKMSDRDFENLATENVNWEELGDENRELLRDWSKRKEKDLMDTAAELQHANAILPIGRDRFFRRFWVFRCIAGLFVEEDISVPNASSDLVVTAVKSDIKENSIANGSRKSLIETPKKLGPETPTKSIMESPEEFLCGSPGIAEHKPSGINGLSLDKPTGLSSNTENKSSDISNNGLSSETPMGLSPSSCSSRPSRPNPRWSFFKSAEQIDCLLASLNPRGFREGPLRNVLAEQSDRLREWLASCDPNELTKSWCEDSVAATETGETCLENSLRKMILDLEERIYASSLGNLKVEDRDAWRSAIQNGGYDSLCSKLTWVGQKNGTRSPSKTSAAEDDESLIGLDESFIGEQAAATPSSSSVVWDLSRAALQVEQMVESKYRTAPLESDTDTLSRWEASLMSRRSTLSRIAVHLTILESSVAWSRSVLNARCRICWRRGDAERMLLCDKCDRGCHMYCLKPPIKTIPSGDWFCPPCRPKKEATTAATRRAAESREHSESSGSDTEEMEEEKEEDSESESQSVSSKDVLTLDSTVNSEDEGSTTENQSKWQPKIKFNQDVSTPSTSRRSSPMPNGSSGKSRSNGRDRPAAQNGTGRTLRSRIVDVEPEESDDNVRTTRAKTTKRKPEQPVHGSASSSSCTSDERFGLKKLCIDLEQDKQRVNDSAKGQGKDGKHSSANGGGGADADIEMQTCWDLVTELTERDEAWPFRKPLGRREAPGYIDVIRQPMDFSTIQSKLADSAYSGPAEVLDDVRLIFHNCAIYYSTPASAEHVAGQKLSRHFERRVRELRLATTSPVGKKDASSSSASRSLRSTRSRRS